MRKELTRIMTGILSLVIVASSTGCKKSETTSNTNQDLTSYPVQTEDSLSYWVALNGNVTATAQTLNDTPFAKELEKETGIKVNYIHPAIGKHDEQFNILIASDNLPDIVEYEWYKYPGGYSKAFNDKFVTDLTPYLDTYLSDYNKCISDKKYSPYIKQAMITDSGKFFGVCPLSGMGKVRLRSVYGPIFRQDWLEELGLEVPETIDEWENVLTQFKEKKNADKPLVFIYEYMDFYSILVGTFGIKKDFFPVDGTIKYGPMEQGYKEFLTKMNDWYKKGLLDKNFASADEKSRNASFMNGECGVTYGFLGSNLIKWEQDMRSINPDVKLVAAKQPSLKKGEPCEIGYTANEYGYSAVSAISAKCKNPDLAAKFLNYGFTEKGSLLYTYGIEGESYEMVDGIPTYTDLIKNNPNNSFAQMLCAYTRAAYTGPMRKEDHFNEQYYSDPKQVDALAKWGESNGEKYDKPYLSVPADDANKVSSIEAKLKQYVDEMTMRFIVGSESLDNFDKYVETLKSFGVEDAISIYQTAFDKAVRK